jgi:ankyrin repeat protein
VGPRNETPLIAAVKCGNNMDIIRCLLENGADPTIPIEFPATSWASKLGEEGIVRLFCELGFPAPDKEATEERFAKLNLDKVLQEDFQRRNAVG